MIELKGARVLVMGLGAHGGGAATARYCARHGADVTVTDLRNEKELRSSLEALSDVPARYVLGRHDPDDFGRADVVFKNPAVRRTAPLLARARRIETDLSLFLSCVPGPVLGVTGTKGKSTTASAIHHLLSGPHPGARLGGNITVSPLGFLDELNHGQPVVLELSSFQLGDLRLTGTWNEAPLPALDVAVITNLLPDHQDYYGSMEDYALDKATVFANQPSGSWAIAPTDGPFAHLWAPGHPRSLRVTAASDPTGRPRIAGPSDIVDRWDDLVGEFPVPGAHSRRNAWLAALAASVFGVPRQTIRDRLASFPGVPHRLERVAAIGNVKFVNDSAATIAEASLAAVLSFSEPIHLIAGGSDKGLSVASFEEIARSVHSLYLLAGTGTDRIVDLLRDRGCRFAGPYGTLEDAVTAASASASRSGDPAVVLLSPGCASFGMFAHEFERGDRFRSIVRGLTGR